ncbi:hypothetical protein [Planobispora longispora]|uniref:Uncharacterized protein n=1 Tax=Planobispora longispora TaxID=28887 RepID=A0A8J3W7W7_9ACTN|nr:hypothetical protein [Planobispora longispora]GIH79217.1 hypothetical protein Plo01_56460 [Planobispora longispora]
MPGPTGPQGRTAVVAASVAGHFLERSIDPVDLRGFDDIEFWASGDRIADGTAGRPFFCEVRLGSAAAPIGSGANRWHRYVPVAGPGPPQRVPFGLDDLPAPVRSACSVIRITFPEAPGSVRLTPPAAVRPQLLADTDAALTARLDNRLSLRGAPVRAVLRAEPDQGRPYLLLVNHSIEHALTRVSTGEIRTDFTETGFAIRSAGVPYDLGYRIEAVADRREDTAALLEFVLAELAPGATLAVGGTELPVEWPAPWERLADGSGGASHALHEEQTCLLISIPAVTRPRAVPRRAVPPHRSVQVEVAHHADM